MTIALYDSDDMRPLAASTSPTSLSIQQVYRFTLPVTAALPTVAQNTSLAALVQALSVNNLVQLFASLLLERRILVCPIVICNIAAYSALCSLRPGTSPS